MARILVAEPAIEVRDLLVRAVRKAGHDVVLANDAVPGDHYDAAIVEPADPDALAAAQRLRRDHPGLPLVFVSIKPPSSATAALEPAAHVVKPFTRAEISQALAAAS